MRIYGGSGGFKRAKYRKDTRQRIDEALDVIRYHKAFISGSIEEATSYSISKLIKWGFNLNDAGKRFVSNKVFSIKS